ncbi:MAG: response regulator [bacterium]|nr:response regulator [bacterium]
MTDEQGEYPLGLHVAFFKDQTEILGIDDVTSAKYAQQFTPSSEFIPNFGVAHAVYWVRFHVRNETRHTTEWRLQMENPYIDYVDLYLPNPDAYEDRFTVKRSGAKIPFHEWETAHRSFMFPLTLPPQAERTYYLRVENDDGILLQMTLWTNAAFFEHSYSEQLWYGFYFGSIAILACYNLFIFFSLRDRSYLYYVLFVTAWGLKELCAEGFSYQYLFPHAPVWNEVLDILSGLLSAFFALRFTAHFLQMATYSPRLNRLMTLLCTGWIILAGASYFVTLDKVAPIINVVTVGTLLMILIVPLKFWYDGYRPARYFVLAWTSFLVTALMAVLASMGILPTLEFWVNTYPVGFIVLMLLLSLALADRINELKAQAEQKRLHSLELQKAKEAAETANQAKSTFLANMTHELRSPLNAILGFAQVMARSRTLSPEQQENIGIIRRNGDHLLTLINQVLDLSKIEAGRTTLNGTNFDLHRLLHDIEDMFALKADNKHLQLMFENDETVPQYVRTDEVKLRQVLINLLNNAIKFTNEGGVAVRVRRERFSDPERVEAFTINLHFEIEDSGPGIAPEEIDTMFEAFGQTETGRQSQEGTGLGLPITRKFVQLMGGDITVSSDVGRGTTFKFDILCEPANSIDSHQSTIVNRVVALKPGQPRYRILIVDDRWANRKLVVKLLKPLGFDLREAVNGQEAIDIWEAWKPHLIWMDMRMPVMDGYETTKRIKAAETATNKEFRMKDEALENMKHETRNTKIIALTASSLEEERAVVLKAGCDDYLRKPFRDTELFELMSTHIGVRFVYEEEKNSTLRQAQGSAHDTRYSTLEERLTTEALAALPALPAEWLESIEQAAVRADVLLLFSVIEQIREQDATLADALAQLAGDFEYDSILGLLEERQK